MNNQSVIDLWKAMGQLEEAKGRETYKLNEYETLVSYQQLIVIDDILAQLNRIAIAVENLKANIRNK